MDGSYVSSALASGVLHIGVSICMLEIPSFSRIGEQTQKTRALHPMQSISFASIARARTELQRAFFRRSSSAK